MKHLALLALLLAFPASAQAATIIEPPGSHFPYQRWADEARVPTPDVTLAVTEAPCGEHNACFSCDEARIYEAPSSVAPRALFLHELGHSVDCLALQDWMRVRFLEILERDGPWEQPGLAWFSPNELFAESWAECAVKPYIKPGPRLGLGSVFGGDPIGGTKRHNRICRMLAHR